MSANRSAFYFTRMFKTFYILLVLGAVVCFARPAQAASDLAEEESTLSPLYKFARRNENLQAGSLPQSKAADFAALDEIRNYSLSDRFLQRAPNLSGRTELGSSLSGD